VFVQATRTEKEKVSGVRQFGPTWSTGIAVLAPLGLPMQDEAVVEEDREGCPSASDG